MTSPQPPEQPAPAHPGAGPGEPYPTVPGAVPQVPVPPGWPEQVPPGPGVRPPFAAPPAERDRRRLWIGIAVGVVALLLCCGGGVVAFGALSVAGANQIRQESRNTVTGYLTALRDREWGTAYSLTCSTRRNVQSLEEFATAQQDQPRVTSWTLGDTEISGSTVIQPADVRYADATGRTVRFRLIRDGSTAGLKVC